MGGGGAWSLALAEPTMFTAMLPVCAGGNAARVAAIKDLPVWCHMGTHDEIVPVKAVDGRIESGRDMRSGGALVLIRLVLVSNRINGSAPQSKQRRRLLPLPRLPASNLGRRLLGHASVEVVAEQEEGCRFQDVDKQRKRRDD